MTEIDRFIYRMEVILRDEQSCGVGRRADPRFSCNGQFYPSALNAAAFLTDQRTGGQMKVKRQEENKQ